MVSATATDGEGNTSEFGPCTSIVYDDVDGDGIADEWESSHGLDPNNAQDSRQIHSSGYAHIEVYLNEVAEQITGQVYQPTDSSPPAAPQRLMVR